MRGSSLARAPSYALARVANIWAKPIRKDTQSCIEARQEAGAKAEEGLEQQTKEGLEERTQKRTRLAADPLPSRQYFTARPEAAAGGQEEADKALVQVRGFRADTGGAADRLGSAAAGSGNGGIGSAMENASQGLGGSFNQTRPESPPRLDAFKMIKVIGKGSFGKCFLRCLVLVFIIF